MKPRTRYGILDDFGEVIRWQWGNKFITQRVKGVELRTRAILGGNMGIKEEIKVAKEVAVRLQKEGDPLPKIVETLNLAYEGFYYTADGRLYRENTPDYTPPARIL